MIPTTSFARLTPQTARIVLGTIALTTLAGVLVTLSPLGSTNLVEGRNRPGDIPLYRAEIDRIHNGEGYYQAAAGELTTRGYPTQSVFNWRTPLPMWLLGKLPSVDLGKALLGIMALALLLAAFEATAREEESIFAQHHSPEETTKPVPWRPIGCALLLTGALQPTVIGDLFVLPVLWSGVWIGLSLCAYGLQRPILAAALGLTALFFRELALPYCVLSAVIAWRQNNRRELLVWSLGLLAWLGLFSLHCWHVRSLIPPDAIAHEHGWIRFGGAGFVISLAQMNAYLMAVPQWVTAIYLVAAMVGIAGWNTPLGTRIGLTTCLFLVTFAVVGQRFNQYWGCMIAPLLCFGVARFPASLRDIWHAAGLSCPRHCRVQG